MLGSERAPATRDSNRAIINKTLASFTQSLQNTSRPELAPISIHIKKLRASGLLEAEEKRIEELI